MKQAADIIPWTVTDISLRPYRGMWSFNPSIHYDGQSWRCSIRCSDYAMPGGVTIRSEKARPNESRTKNAMVIFDPTGWKAVEIYKMRERDDWRRAPSSSVGYEDIRLFRTDRYGLQGIAAALHLRRTDRSAQVAEQVLLSFDDEYNIVDARPIRGGSWSSQPQKNWAPFDNCAEPRFLYAIDKGSLFDERGDLRGRDAVVRASTRPRAALSTDLDTVERARERAEDVEREHSRERDREERRRQSVLLGAPFRDLEISSSEGLRGGTQLVRVDDNSWLGLGHAMWFVDNRKYYWHVWYLVDASGKLAAVSPPMKLVQDGIEFAAGLAIAGERVIVSFGVDDMQCRIGETTLSAVIEMLRPMKAQP